MVGDVLEYTAKAAAMLINGKSEQEIIKALMSGTEGAERAMPGYAASVLSPHITITINDKNFANINNLPDSSFSGGSDKFYAKIS